MKPVAVLLFSLFIFAAGCSQKIDAGDPASAIDGFSKAKTNSEKRLFFTSETLNLIDSAKQRGIANSSYFLSSLEGNASWVERDRHVDGDRAVIRVQILSHPVENLTGAEMLLSLKRDGKGWKIDLTEEFAEALSERGSSADVYLKGLRPQ